MPKTFTFTVPAVTGDEATPTHAKLYSSTSLSGAKTAEETTTLVALGYTSSPPEELTWTVASVDGTKYYWLHLLAGSVEGPPVVLLPEAATGTVTIIVYTETAIGAAVSGLKLRATPLRKGGGASATKTIVQRGEATTDVNGFASITLYADSGEYQIELVGYSSFPFDTTGRSGDTVNFADEL